MRAYYFTFGSNHLDGSGNSLGQCYVPIEAEDEDAARSLMEAARGRKWSHVYPGTESAGVEEYGLTARTLESVTLDPVTERRRIIAAKCHEEREGARAALAMMDKAEEVLSRLPNQFVDRLWFFGGEWNISGCTREEVAEILRAMSAAKWDKTLTCKGATTIDYKTSIEGVRLCLYRAAPPPSCEIIEETVDLPARQEVRRKLVCI